MEVSIAKKDSGLWGREHGSVAGEPIATPM